MIEQLREAIEEDLVVFIDKLEARVERSRRITAAIAEQTLKVYRDEMGNLPARWDFPRPLDSSSQNR